MMVAVPTPSLTLWLAADHWTVGWASLSVMVRVWVVGAVAVALVGAPISTTTVSSGSSLASSTRVTVMLALVLPGRDRRAGWR